MSKQSIIAQAKKEFEEKWKSKGYALSDGFDDAWLFHESQLSKAIDAALEAVKVEKKPVFRQSYIGNDENAAFNEAVAEQEKKAKEFLESIEGE